MVKTFEGRVEPLDLYFYDWMLWIYGTITFFVFPLMGYALLLQWLIGAFFPALVIKVILDKMRTKSGTCDNGLTEKTAT